MSVFSVQKMTTIRQLGSRDFQRAAAFVEANLATSEKESAPSASCKLSAAGDGIHHLPRRPDPSILSNAISLFFIGRSRRGFWVAREAEGKIGGLFLRRRSALRFAKKCSEPLGCATMLLDGPFELDIENQGGKVTILLTAASETAARRLPTAVAFFGAAATEWRKLVAEVSRVVVGQRRNRATVERELFHGLYRLSSKNDDDLPVS